MRRAKNATLGRVVARLRVAAGLSQQQVADKIGVAASYISQIEASARVPSLGVIRKLARILGADWRALGRQALIESEPEAATLWTMTPIPCLRCAETDATLGQIADLANAARERSERAGEGP